MTRAYTALLSRHERILRHWDTRDPNMPEQASPTQRLRRSRVLLLASGAVGQQVAASLLQLELGALNVFGLLQSDLPGLNQILKHPGRKAREVTVGTSAFDTPGFSVTLARHHLLVVAGGRPQPALLEQINLDCLRAGTAWTQGQLWGEAITIGPTIIPGVTACHLCYTRRLQANQERPDVAQARDAFLRNDPQFEFRGQLQPLVNLTAAYLFGETQRFLGGAPAPLALGRVLSLHGLSQTHGFDHVPRLEWCQDCAEFVEHEPGETLSQMVARLVARRGGA